MVTEDAKGAGGIAESLRDQRGREPLDEVGSKSLVLAVGGGGGLEEKPGFTR